jgi:recombination protein RecA
MQRSLSVASRRALVEVQVGKLPTMHRECMKSLESITQSISTGIPVLDKALEIGGIPQGFITEIFGLENTGKTTVALRTIATTQSRGGLAAFIDAEHRLERNYPKSLGVDLNELMLYRPKTAEQAFDIAGTLLGSNHVDLVVIDSIAGLVPRREYEGDAESWDSNAAGLIARSVRKLAVIASRHGSSLLFLNQMRYQPQVVFGKYLGTPGGQALRHHASVRIELRIVSRVHMSDRAYRTVVKATVVKNSLGRTCCCAEFEIDPRFGPDQIDGPTICH